MRTLFLWMFLLIAKVSMGVEATELYIEKYKDLAISEMRRTGIPASIKLAQGMLESGMGRSVLAVDANNHFGIKCGRRWDGDTFFREDDERDKAGNLKPSCFRSFDTVRDSYIAHSTILSYKRYAFLYKYSTQDYKSWAKGLRKAGYATDPKYPAKIIRVIEKYNLNRFDNVTEEADTLLSDDYIMDLDLDIMEYPQESDDITFLDTNAILPKAEDYSIHYMGRLKYIRAKGGETPQLIAQLYNIEEKELNRYNDFREDEYVLDIDDIVFLAPKKRRYRGDEEWHIVNKGETLQSISQNYGVRLSRLRKLNRLPKDAIILTGEKIALKNRVTTREVPNYVKVTNKRTY